jgi:ubiquinone/menaquinone biosynthesis C-methylase UbiE
MAMSLTRFIKDVLRRNELISTPFAVFYNATAAKVLRKPETKVATDVVAKMGSGTILDLGSGPGYLSIDIAKRSPSLHIYGIDLSRQMVKIARRHAQGVDNARFVFGNAAKLPFKDNSIDLVISTGALHHWRTPRLVLDECYRVLKTGQEAWIYDWCPDIFHNPADSRKLNEEYGFFVRRLGPLVSALHGFTREEYQTEIKGHLEQTIFKDNYQMALTDIWMKITLKKRQ